MPAIHAAYKKIRVLYLLAFGMVTALFWIHDIVVPPHHLFGIEAIPESLSQTAFASILVVALALFVDRKTRRILRHIRRIEAFLPICSSCKRIRDSNGSWIAVESYIRDRTNSEFSHSICPDCERRFLPPED